MLVVGGGGSGGADVGGGGGAGGLIEGVISQPVTATAYTITVGAGGAARTDGSSGNAGSPSYFCLLYTSPSPRDGLLSRMPSSA